MATFKTKANVADNGTLTVVGLPFKPGEQVHWLTHGTRKQVAKQLTKLTSPWGIVSENDYWMPEGFCDIELRQQSEQKRMI